MALFLLLVFVIPNFLPQEHRILKYLANAVGMVLHGGVAMLAIGYTKFGRVKTEEFSVHCIWFNAGTACIYYLFFRFT